MPGFELIGDEEFDEVKDVFNHGGVLFRHGFEAIRNNCFKVKQFEENFAKAMGSDYSLAVSSGTAALRVALAALNISNGDEVITQCFTFVATVEAIIESGATPICAEIDKTLNLDPEDLRRRITKKTKAVIAVHMLGTPARLDEITEICKLHNIKLIEDTAWGCGGSLKGKNLGTWGDVGTFSFDFAKTMTTGEGGMLVFKDHAVWKRATAWHDHGHENNPTLPRWEDSRSTSGFNYRMMELQGAIGLAQLRKLSYVVRQQRKNLSRLWSKISLLEGVEKRESPAQSYETADSLIFFVRDNATAKSCRNNLISLGFNTKILPEAYTWHFAGTWNHMPELMAAHNENLKNEFSFSRQILSRAVSLPIGINLSDDSIYKIFTAIQKGIG